MAENDNIFLKITRGEIPADIVYQDERCIAFRDINPQAPVHILVIPREALESLNDASQSDEGLLGHLLRVVSKVANKVGIAEKGYRVVINTGQDGGQTVSHLHLHLLGGRDMTWPPG
ncbi:MAG: histidine triad nucleotide-binding protein [Blastocatellia bacterium]|nr:histidine triad nucleotide-binding protein [Blastocatellia bacterium]